MEEKSKKCKQCGSEDVFKERNKEQKENVRCLLCGFTATNDVFYKKEETVKDE